MNRITEFEIAGTMYPLNFSAKSAEEIAERYGSLESVTDAFGKNTLAENTNEAIWLLKLLLDQGAAYKEIVEDIKIKTFTVDQLKVLVGLGDFGDIKETIMTAMFSGMKREVEVEQGLKNEKTTLGQ